MAETRRQFSAEQKIAVLRRHLLEHVAVSDLCDEYGIQPSVLYRWQQQLFENGAAAFGHLKHSTVTPEGSLRNRFCLVHVIAQNVTRRTTLHFPARVENRRRQCDGAVKTREKPGRRSRSQRGGAKVLVGRSKCSIPRHKDQEGAASRGLDPQRNQGQPCTQ